ncbi:MAG: hypothetical protein J6U49_04510 [Alistipes sp.]|nr:hypothetical protein [Alistipes sp.]
MVSESTYYLLRELGSGGYSRHYLPHEVETIERLYLEIMGRPVKVCQCKDRHHDAVLEMLNIAKRARNMASTYILKRGVIIHYNNEVYSNANLTNEVAAAFLAERPSAEGLFAFIPSKKKATAAKKVAPKKSTKKTA